MGRWGGRDSPYAAKDALTMAEWKEKEKAKEIKQLEERLAKKQFVGMDPEQIKARIEYLKSQGT